MADREALVFDPDAHPAVSDSTATFSALIECGDQRPQVIKSLERGEQSLLAELPKVRRDDPMLLCNVWTHAYGIQALVVHGQLPDDALRREKIEGLIRDQFAALTKYESAEGAGAITISTPAPSAPASSSTSFVNATVLVAFHDAKSIGIDPPRELLDRGLLMTQKQRNPDNTHIYGTYLRNSPVMPINRAGGSLGRSQACDLALRLWGTKPSTTKCPPVELRLSFRNMFEPPSYCCFKP